MKREFFLLVTEAWNLEKLFKLRNRDRDAKSKPAMRSCYFTCHTCLLLNKRSMDKEILILFQNKYYCLPVLDIPVHERNGNRERKRSCVHFFIPVKKHMKSAWAFCPISLLPWMLTETVLLNWQQTEPDPGAVYREMEQWWRKGVKIALFVLFNL